MSAMYLVLRDIGRCKPSVHIYRVQFLQIQQHRYLCVFGKQHAGFSLGRGSAAAVPGKWGWTEFQRAGAGAAGSCFGVKAGLQVTHVLQSHMETQNHTCIHNTGRPRVMN